VRFLDRHTASLWLQSCTQVYGKPVAEVPQCRRPAGQVTQRSRRPPSESRSVMHSTIMRGTG
jgi:hypothetical protein